MLSFLQEEKVEDVLGQGQNVAGKTIANGQAKDKEYIAVTTKGKSAQKNTVLLGVLFGIGLLCLGIMIKNSTKQDEMSKSNTAEELQIEMAISKLGGVSSEIVVNMEKIVQKFYQFSNVQQVKVNELVKNPFALKQFNGDNPKISKADNSDINSETIVKQQVKNLQLISIMNMTEANGKVIRCCMINDKIVYEGDSIKNFTVLKINSNFVELESAGIKIILKLSE